MPLLVDFEGLTPFCHDPLGLIKGFLVYDPQIRPLHHHPFRLIPVLSPTSKKISDLLLAVDDLPSVELVGKNAADSVLAPLAVTLCPNLSLVEKI